MHIFSKNSLTIERWIRAGEPAIGCVEASRTRGCMVWPVDVPPPSSSHPRYPLHVRATHADVFWWDPRLLHACD